MDARPRDLTRQIVVIASATFMIIASLVGIGLFGGTPVQDVQGGALDADSTFLAPARPAFQIWSAIYLGLIVYTVWQALPAQRTDRRQRATGSWIALSMVLNGVWLVAAQFATLLLTVLAIVALLIVLCIAFTRALAHRPERWVDALLIDGVTGLHLGWVTLATVANITAWLTAIAPDGWRAAVAVGVGVLVIVAVIGLGIGWAAHDRLAATAGPSVALAWGLAWVAVARLTGEPASTAIGVTAIVVAVVVLVPAVAAIVRRVTHPASKLHGPI